MLRKLSAVFLLILTSLGFIAGNVNAANEQAKQEVVFADAGWDSVKFHNAVAGFIGTPITSRLRLSVALHLSSRRRCSVAT